MPTSRNTAVSKTFLLWRFVRILPDSCYFLVVSIFGVTRELTITWHYSRDELGNLCFDTVISYVHTDHTDSGPTTVTPPLVQYTCREHVSNNIISTDISGLGIWHIHCRGCIIQLTRSCEFQSCEMNSGFNN